MHRRTAYPNKADYRNGMEHSIILSADGSSTLKLKDFQETYHSSNGAFSEAVHIYIRNGLEQLLHRPTTSGTIRPAAEIRIFDIGLGTGLNCLLSLIWQQTAGNSPAIYYHAIEKYPIPTGETAQLNFPGYIAARLPVCENTIPSAGPELSEKDLAELFRKIHAAPWETDTRIAPGFTLHKTEADISAFQPHPDNRLCIIYYDTFSPATQPGLWETEIFRKFHEAIPAGSMLVTYCAKGTVKQNLRAAGFTVKRLPGPPGKRHIIAAGKPGE